MADETSGRKDFSVRVSLDLPLHLVERIEAARIQLGVRSQGSVIRILLDELFLDADVNAEDQLPPGHGLLLDIASKDI